MKRNKKTLVITLICIAALAAGVAFAYALLRQDGPSNSPSASTPTISPSAPTQEEKDAANDQKQNNVKNENKEESPATDNSVTISYFGETNKVVEVNAFTSYYADGTCRFTFKNGSLSLTRSVSATRDATTTICSNPLIPASEFPADGNWTVTVSYKSNDGSKSGTSDSRTLMITR